MSAAPTDSRPCSGIRVLAVARVVASPFAAYQLALHGADVIRIEDTLSGDSMRQTGGKELGLPQRGMGTAYLANGANMRSLTLNLRSEEGRNIFRTLAKDSDVVLENLITGSMAKNGLGWEDLRKINPRLVYCSLTGYGSTGPKRSQPGNDGIIQAASGLMSLTGSPDGAPVKTGAHIFDYGSGFAAALGIVMALLHRNVTGRGQFIDVSMLETAMVMNADTVSDVLNANATPMRRGNTGSNVAGKLNGTFRCKGGSLLLIITSTEQKTKLFWPTIGRPDIPKDPRFATPEAKAQNLDALFGEVEKTLLTKTAKEWEEILAEAAIGCSEIKSVADAIAQPQIQARQPYHDLGVVPELGLPIKVPLAPYRLSEGGARVNRAPPLKGQHTDEILASLGYKEEAIKALRKDGVV